MGKNVDKPPKQPKKRATKKNTAAVAPSEQLLFPLHQQQPQVSGVYVQPPIAASPSVTQWQQSQLPQLQQQSHNAMGLTQVTHLRVQQEQPQPNQGMTMERMRMIMAAQQQQQSQMMQQQQLPTSSYHLSSAPFTPSSMPSHASPHNNGYPMQSPSFSSIPMASPTIGGQRHQQFNGGSIATPMASPMRMSTGHPSIAGPSGMNGMSGTNHHQSQSRPSHPSMDGRISVPPSPMGTAGPSRVPMDVMQPQQSRPLPSPSYLSVHSSSQYVVPSPSINGSSSSDGRLSRMDAPSSPLIPGRVSRMEVPSSPLIQQLPLHFQNIRPTTPAGAGISTVMMSSPQPSHSRTNQSMDVGQQRGHQTMVSSSTPNVVSRPPPLSSLPSPSFPHIPAGANSPSMMLSSPQPSRAPSMNGGHVLSRPHPPSMPSTSYSSNGGFKKPLPVLSNPTTPSAIIVIDGEETAAGHRGQQQVQQRRQMQPPSSPVTSMQQESPLLSPSSSSASMVRTVPHSPLATPSPTVSTHSPQQQYPPAASSPPQQVQQPAQAASPPPPPAPAPALAPVPPPQQAEQTKRKQPDYQVPCTSTRVFAPSEYAHWRYHKKGVERQTAIRSGAYRFPVMRPEQTWASCSSSSQLENPFSRQYINKRKAERAAKQQKEEAVKREAEKALAEFNKAKSEGKCIVPGCPSRFADIPDPCTGHAGGEKCNHVPAQFDMRQLLSIRLFDSSGTRDDAYFTLVSELVLSSSLLLQFSSSSQFLDAMDECLVCTRHFHPSNDKHAYRFPILGLSKRAVEIDSLAGKYGMREIVPHLQSVKLDELNLNVPYLPFLPLWSPNEVDPRPVYPGVIEQGEEIEQLLKDLHNKAMIRFDPAGERQMDERRKKDSMPERDEVVCDAEQERRYNQYLTQQSLYENGEFNETDEDRTRRRAFKEEADRERDELDRQVAKARIGVQNILKPRETNDPPEGSIEEMEEAVYEAIYLDDVPYLDNIDIDLNVAIRQQKEEEERKRIEEEEEEERKRRAAIPLISLEGRRIYEKAVKKIISSTPLFVMSQEWFDERDRRNSTTLEIILEALQRINRLPAAPRVRLDVDLNYVPPVPLISLAGRRPIERRVERIVSSSPIRIMEESWRTIVEREYMMVEVIDEEVEQITYPLATPYLRIDFDLNAAIRKREKEEQEERKRREEEEERKRREAVPLISIDNRRIYERTVTEITTSPPVRMRRMNEAHYETLRQRGKTERDEQERLEMERRRLAVEAEKRRKEAEERRLAQEEQRRMEEQVEKRRRREEEEEKRRFEEEQVKRRLKEEEERRKVEEMEETRKKKEEEEKRRLKEQVEKQLKEVEERKKAEEEEKRRKEEEEEKKRRLEEEENKRRIEEMEEKRKKEEEEKQLREEVERKKAEEEKKRLKEELEKKRLKEQEEKRRLEEEEEEKRRMKEIRLKDMEARKKADEDKILKKEEERKKIEEEERHVKEMEEQRCMDIEERKKEIAMQSRSLVSSGSPHAVYSFPTPPQHPCDEPVSPNNLLQVEKNDKKEAETPSSPSSISSRQHSRPCSRESVDSHTETIAKKPAMEDIQEESDINGDIINGKPKDQVAYSASSSSSVNQSSISPSQPVTVVIGSITGGDMASSPSYFKFPSTPGLLVTAFSMRASVDNPIMDHEKIEEEKKDEEEWQKKSPSPQSDNGPREESDDDKDSDDDEDKDGGGERIIADDAMRKEEDEEEKNASDASVNEVAEGEEELEEETPVSPIPTPSDPVSPLPVSSIPDQSSIDHLEEDEKEEEDTTKEDDTPAHSSTSLEEQDEKKKESPETSNSLYAPIPLEENPRPNVFKQSKYNYLAEEEFGVELVDENQIATSGDKKVDEADSTDTPSCSSQCLPLKGKSSSTRRSLVPYGNSDDEDEEDREKEDKKDEREETATISPAENNDEEETVGVNGEEEEKEEETPEKDEEEKEETEDSSSNPIDEEKEEEEEERRSDVIERDEYLVCTDEVEGEEEYVSDHEYDGQDDHLHSEDDRPPLLFPQNNYPSPSSPYLPLPLSTAEPMVSPPSSSSYITPLVASRPSIDETIADVVSSISSVPSSLVPSTSKRRTSSRAVTRKMYLCPACGLSFKNQESLDKHPQHCQPTQAVSSSLTSFVSLSMVPSISTRLLSGAVITRAESGTTSMMRKRKRKEEEKEEDEEREDKDEDEIEEGGEQDNEESEIITPPEEEVEEEEEEDDEQGEEEQEEREEEREEEEGEEQEQERGDSKYPCSLCGRIFTNPNSFAAHSRHCQEKHGVESKTKIRLLAKKKLREEARRTKKRIDSKEERDEHHRGQSNVKRGTFSHPSNQEIPSTSSLPVPSLPPSIPPPSSIPSSPSPRITRGWSIEEWKKLCVKKPHGKTECPICHLHFNESEIEGHLRRHSKLKKRETMERLMNKTEMTTSKGKKRRMEEDEDEEKEIKDESSTCVRTRSFVNPSTIQDEQSIPTQRSVVNPPTHSSSFKNSPQSEQISYRRHQEPSTSSATTVIPPLLLSNERDSRRPQSTRQSNRQPSHISAPAVQDEPSSSSARPSLPPSMPALPLTRRRREEKEDEEVEKGRPHESIGQHRKDSSESTSQRRRKRDRDESIEDKKQEGTRPKKEGKWWKYEVVDEKKKSSSSSIVPELKKFQDTVAPAEAEHFVRRSDRPRKEVKPEEKKVEMKIEGLEEERTDTEEEDKEEKKKEETKKRGRGQKRKLTVESSEEEESSDDEDEVRVTRGMRKKDKKDDDDDEFSRNKNGTFRSTR